MGWSRKTKKRYVQTNTIEGSLSIPWSLSRWFMYRYMLTTLKVDRAFAVNDNRKFVFTLLLPTMSRKYSRICLSYEAFAKNTERYSLENICHPEKKTYFCTLKLAHDVLLLRKKKTDSKILPCTAM